MRTVLIGSDFMYDSNGNLRPIELNTAVGWDNSKIEGDDDVFNLTELNTFITSNNFNKVIYIGGIFKLNKILNTNFSGTSIEYQFYETDTKAITIPYVEDDPSILIIRSAYDTTAIVDEEYCKDKIGFLNLINSSSTFGSEFAYKDSNGNLINNITTIVDNGENPNFILKSRYPSYDRNIYPRLFRVSNQSELDVVLQEVTDEYFLMPFYFNESKTYENHIKIFRGLNILYPPNLTSISLGGYTKITPLKLNYGTNEYNPTTYELSSTYRDKYITKSTLFSTPKLEDSDLVQLHDGSWKTALELEVGDLLKTINFPLTDNVNILDELVNLNITFEQLQSGSTYSTNSVLVKKRVDKITNIIKLTFTDNTEWEDTEYSSYLINSQENIRFSHINNLNIGDKVILVDTTNPEQVIFVEKEVQLKNTVRSIFSGWEITVAREHIFLTKSTEGQSTSYAAIEHNVNCACPTCSYCPKDCSPPTPVCTGGVCTFPC